MPQEPGRWITIQTNKPNARTRLICFPFAGGTSVVYHSWLSLLPDDIDLCAVELPGHGARLREPLMHDLAPLVEEAHRGLQPWLEPPFVFFGHSLGATICFELTHRLEHNQGPSPCHVFLSGRRPPHRPSRNAKIHHLPDEQFRQELRQLQGTPEEILGNDELMKILLPILRADFQLVEDYAPRTPSPIECPLTVYGGMTDDEAPASELNEWERYTNSGFRPRIPGNHFFLNTARVAVIQTLLQDLAPSLS